MRDLLRYNGDREYSVIMSGMLYICVYCHEVVEPLFYMSNDVSHTGICMHDPKTAKCCQFLGQIVWGAKP